ncbi:MAG: isoprenylcysteine carboxylmethyltransferase family protein [Bacteroidales bacterium]|nr:isoprenylcysteine carboxylmethyltransferase family protein [Bacteroidales bacterium]
MKENLIIIGVLLILSLSGIYINFFRHKNLVKVEFVSSDSSLNHIRLLIPLSLLVSYVFFLIGYGSYKNTFLFLSFAFVFIITGLILRWFAVYSLGASFQVKLQIHKQQKLKTNGVFSFIRHPSYLGSILYYIGLALLMHNYFSLITLAIVPTIVIISRIEKEEKMLLSHFGTEYQTYINKSYRLIPFIY